MSFTKVALILFFYIGVLQSVFFALYLFISKKGNIIANRWLGVLLLALVMRLGKSAIIVSIGYRPDMLISIGLSSYLIIGALMLLYFKALTNPDFRFRKIDILQFVPFLIVITCSYWIPYPPNYSGAYKAYISPYYNWFYRGLHIYLFVYLMINLRWLAGYYKTFRQQKKPTSLEQAKWFWMRSLWGMLFIVWGFYMTHNIFRVPRYHTSIIIYSVLVFVLGMVALFNAQVFTQTFSKPKYQTSPLKNQETDEHIAQIRQLMEGEKAFKNPELTLPRMAEMLSMPTYQLSQIVNEHLASNFADFINQYRVNEAKQLLTDPKYDHYKIAGIAFESGFNNLSSFNTAFKKRVELTPSQYRKQYSVV
ncbi:hypothetical protein BKI52_32600 [marine bacterium AO1-C]|nr:hypothetical protein BKI52_32600 [marine bacterium AO1-C]